MAFVEWRARTRLVSQLSAVAIGNVTVCCAAYQSAWIGRGLCCSMVAPAATVQARPNTPRSQARSRAIDHLNRRLAVIISRRPVAGVPGSRARLIEAVHGGLDELLRV